MNDSLSEPLIAAALLQENLSIWFRIMPRCVQTQIVRVRGFSQKTCLPLEIAHADIG